MSYENFELYSICYTYYNKYNINHTLYIYNITNLVNLKPELHTQYLAN